MKDTVLYAGMESSGPWYSPPIKAHCLLGKRAMADQLMSGDDVAAQVETNLRDYLSRNGTGRAPSRQIVNKWERDSPDYPEWALAHGLVNKSDLLPWARSQLKSDYGGPSGKAKGRNGPGKTKTRSAKSKSRKSPRRRGSQRPETTPPSVLQTLNMSATA